MTAIRKTLLAALTLAALTGSAIAQEEVFRIGLLGGENEADRLRDTQCLVDLLPAALGVKEVQLFPAADYDGVVQGLLGGTLDYAELGASAYAAVVLKDPAAVEAILTTEQTDGSTGYYSIMLARKDSGIATLADMKGKNLGFADPDSTSGYLVPLVSLPADTGAPVEEFFGSTDFGGGHENLILAVLDGKFDAGTTWGSGVGEFSDGYTSGNVRSMVDKGLWYGFDGSIEIRDTQVVVRRRFLGWVNFFFDTNSAFFGMSPPDVFGVVFGGPEIEPGRSNLSLAFNDFLNNGEWQHLDVFIKLLQTIVMAFVGTLFACIVAFPLAFLAARNINRNRPVNWLLKRCFDFTRSVDMLIWALFFTRGFGPGPIAGIAAIFFTDTGTFGKLYSEALENIDDKQREGVRSVGASPAEVQRYGVVPQVLPLFASQALYFWESNTRSATIIGAVGAGGIGLKLLEAMRTNNDWENVAYMVLLILVVVFIFDGISNAIRSRLIGLSPAAKLLR